MSFFAVPRVVGVSKKSGRCGILWELPKLLCGENRVRSWGTLCSPVRQSLDSHSQLAVGMWGTDLALELGGAEPGPAWTWAVSLLSIRQL